MSQYRFVVMLLCIAGWSIHALGKASVDVLELFVGLIFIVLVSIYTEIQIALNKERNDE